MVSNVDSPDHLPTFAAGVVALAEALSIVQFDAFGFSVGGTVPLVRLLYQSVARGKLMFTP